MKSNEHLDEYQNYYMENFEEVEPQYSSIEEERISNSKKLNQKLHE